MSNIQDDPPIAALQQTRALQQAFAESRQRVYLERPRTLSELEQFIPPPSDAAAHPQAPSTLVVTGPSGSGKSALLAHWCQRVALQNPRAAVIAFFVGAAGLRLSHLEMIRHLLEELRERFGITEAIPTDPNELENALGLWLQRLQGKPLLLLLDALDQLDESSQDLRWLPGAVPATVRMIISARESVALEALRRRDLPTLEITPLSYSERLQLSAQYLGKRREAIGPEVIERVAKESGSGNPLFHRIRVTELRQARNAEEATAIVDRYTTAGTLEEMYVRVFERIETEQGGDLVGDVLGLLATSRRGLDREDLLALSGASVAALDGVLGALTNHLIRQGDHLQLYHDAMSRAIAGKYLPDESERTRIHLRIGARLTGEIPERIVLGMEIDTGRAQGWIEAAYHLRQAGAWEPLRQLVCSIPVFVSLNRVAMMSDLLVCWRCLIDEGIDPMESYDRALLEYRRRGPSGTELLDAYLQLGRMLVVLGRLDTATEMFRRMEEMAEEIDDRPSIARAECELAWVLHRQGRTAEAMELVNRTSALALATGDRKLIASVEHIMGMICYEHGDHAQALEHFERQLEVARELADRHGIAAATGRLGVIYCDQGEYPRALECYRQQLSIMQELGDRQRTADANCIMGILYQAMGDHDRALECYGEQLRIAQELGYRAGIGSATANMGNIYQEQGDYPRALESFELLLLIARELGDPQRISNAIGCMANLYSQQGCYARALECYREALTQQRAIGYLAGMTSWLHGAALVILELVLDAREMPAYLPTYIPSLLEAESLPADDWRRLSLQEARRQAEECIEISERLRKSDTLWGARTLVARIDAAEGDAGTAIRKLDTMLGEVTADDPRADLHYYLWRICVSCDPASIVEEGSLEKHRTEALRLYEELYEQTPRLYYRHRIEEIGGENTGADVTQG